MKKKNVSSLIYKPKESQLLIAQSHMRTVLGILGHDVKREGLLETPKRYIKFLNEFCNPEEFNFTTFTNEGVDQMIICKDIPFYSVCEHHLAPFFGVAHIAYIPNKKIVGLSKLPRALDMFARRPQNQERIGTETVNYINEQLKPKGVGIIIEARHMCVEMRGVRKPGTVTTTSALVGCFKNQSVKNEFINLIKK